MEASLEDLSYQIHTRISHFLVVRALSRNSADLPRVKHKDKYIPKIINLSKLNKSEGIRVQNNYANIAIHSKVLGYISIFKNLTKFANYQDYVCLNRQISLNIYIL